MRARLIFGFLLAELLASGFIFGSAMWGRELLAPVDIAPAFFSKYRFVDPASSGIPANHYIIDQLTYDLPLQMTVYRAYHEGKIPWWDPYDSAGRPLLADAHINGTDPLRCILYRFLPFELAYNWTLIGHCLLSGIAMLLLLRHFGFADWQCALLAITYQFSTSLVLHFATWVDASFGYYPLLWLAWDKWILERKWPWLGGGALVTAAILLSGSLQTDAYLAVFSAAVLFGYGGLDKAIWKRALGGILFCGCAGFCLAGPVILGQLELFFLSIRKIHTPFNPWEVLAPLGSLSAVYPWALGTFRTLDLSKIAAQRYHFGFVLYIGSAAICLALLGALDRVRGSALRLQRPRRTAFWLLGLYLLIASTPLEKFLYLRVAPLAGMALIVLAGIGISAAVENHPFCRRLGKWVLILSLGIAIITNFLALAVYPKFLPLVREKLLTGNTSMPGLAPLRNFQAENFPREVSFRNPETVIAIAGMLLLALLLMNRALRNKPAWWMLLLVVNTTPVLLYSGRFIPRQPIALWERLRNGGPEQQRVEGLLRDTPLRFYEVAPSIWDQVFPLAMGHLYRVRTVQGYAALPLLSVSDLPEAKVAPQLADFIYRTAEPGAARGELTTNATPGLARFQWSHPLDRSFDVAEPGVNTIKLHFAAGEAGTLVWSDSYFPGWRASVDGREVPLRRYESCFSAIDVPASAQELVLRYQPRLLKAGMWVALIGVVGLTATFVPWRRKRQQLHAEPVATPAVSR